MTTNNIDIFTSSKNKGTIWTLMNEYEIFNGISDHYVTNIKQLFDTKVNIIAQNMTTADTLTILNKRVIREMVSELEHFKNRAPNTFTEPIQQPITLEEIQTQKQTLFQKNLQQKQNEFDGLIKTPLPEKVDFTDEKNGLDKPIGAEMDKKLAETIAWREQQLNMVLNIQPNKEAATKWIQSEQENIKEIMPLSNRPPNNNNNNNNNNNTSRQLKIGNDTTIDKNTIINVNDKKVSFSEKVSFSNENENENENENNNDNNNFLNLLKRKKEEPIVNVNDTDIINNNNNNNNNIHYDTITNELVQIKEQLKQLFEIQQEILQQLKEKDKDKDNII